MHSFSYLRIPVTCWCSLVRFNAHSENARHPSNSDQCAEDTNLAICRYQKWAVSLPSIASIGWMFSYMHAYRFIQMPCYVLCVWLYENPCSSTGDPLGTATQHKSRWPTRGMRVFLLPLIYLSTEKSHCPCCNLSLCLWRVAPCLRSCGMEEPEP